MRAAATTPIFRPATGLPGRAALLAASLLLHLLLLALLLDERRTPERHLAAPAPLSVRLLGASAPPGAPAATARAPAAPPKPRPKPSPPRSSTPAAASAAPAAALPAPATAAAGGATALAASTPDALPDTPPPLEYLIRIARLVSRSQRYPWSARQYGQQGDVLVRVHLHRDGRVLSVRLLQSSGVAALDAEACAVMQRIARFPPFPADYLPQIAEFDLDQPVNFRHYQD
ncbi:protein TonB [Solimonas aquatica]|uniref:Protein TonB n=1 Tax=Solimonas aquatica TaxID=489703 RepID=A0A1H9D442_9GAMM|nr:energy transducer TonB [Solimonas aquatica]SEQ07558.1 protein TonB [Solimonas aquatica]